MALSISQFKFGPRSLTTSTGRPARELSKASSGWISTRMSEDRSALFRLVLLTILPVRVASSPATWKLTGVVERKVDSARETVRQVPEMTMKLNFSPRELRRDYYLVQTRSGQRAWAFRPVGDGGPLQLHGWFA